MLRASTLRAFVFLVQGGARRAYQEKAQTVLGGIFLGLTLFIFSQLWVALKESSVTFSALQPRDFVWYLMLTELVVLSTPRVFFAVQEEITSGAFDVRILKPFPPPLIYFAGACGELLVRLALMLVVGTVVTYAIVGAPPSDCLGLLEGYLLVPFACVVLLLFYLAIGLTSGWIHDTIPLTWVFNKSMFTLGGLMVPLLLFPDILRFFAYATPFPALLYLVARGVFGSSVAGFLTALLALVFWGMVAAGLSLVLYKRLLQLRIR